jgi:hypothetical protein
MNVPKIILSKYDIERAGLPGSAFYDKIIERKPLWTVHRILFNWNDKVYSAFYSSVSIDDCDEDPCRFGDFTEATEMIRVGKTVMVWSVAP